MDTRWWGPEVHDLIHFFTIVVFLRASDGGRDEKALIPSQLIELFAAWIRALATVLPCLHCRKAYGDLIRCPDHDPSTTITDANSIVAWGVETHRTISRNVRNGAKAPRNIRKWRDAWVLRIQDEQERERLMQYVWDLLFCIQFTFPQHSNEDEDKLQRRENITTFLRLVPAFLDVAFPEAVVSRAAWQQAMQTFACNQELANRETFLTWLLHVLDACTDVTPPWWQTGSYTGKRRPSIFASPSVLASSFMARYLPAIAVQTKRLGKGVLAWGCRGTADDE